MIVGKNWLIYAHSDKDDEEYSTGNGNKWLIESTYQNEDHSEDVEYEIDVDVSQFFVYLGSKDESVGGVVKW